MQLLYLLGSMYRNGRSNPLGAAVALDIAARARLGAAGAQWRSKWLLELASEPQGRSKWLVEPASELQGRSNWLFEPASEPQWRSQITFEIIVRKSCLCSVVL